MDKQQDLLPFKVGQLAESRSFQPGFRGAWFRCKINEISWRQWKIKHALEFFDFPDEKVKWTKVYQVPQGRKSKEMKRQLMVRPPYPPIYHESQIPNANAISEVIVVANGVWKEGDLVDWWSDGCYWSGKVTHILGNDKVRIKLPPPPDGEGLPYEVFCTDLRPYLDWSPEHGWSIPTSEEGENCCCARLIEPLKQAGLPNSKLQAVDEGTKYVQATPGSPPDASFSSQISANSSSPMNKSKRPEIMGTSGQPLGISIPKEATEGPQLSIVLNMGDATGKTSWSDSTSSSRVRDTSTETVEPSAGEDQYYCSGSFKKIRIGGDVSLNSMSCDTLEAAVFEMEELVSRVKWLKGILQFGIPLSNAERSSWKFVEQRASSTPK